MFAILELLKRALKDAPGVLKLLDAIDAMFRGDPQTFPVVIRGYTLQVTVEMNPPRVSVVLVQ